MITWATPFVSIAADTEHTLPGCFKRLEPGTQETIVTFFKFVAVLAGDGTWAAYYGPADWSDTKVASGGEKLGIDGARHLFPNISQPYRP